MHPGEWRGKSVPNGNGILILGESHYGREDEPNYKTSDVVEAYLCHRLLNCGSAKWDRFFDSIAASFGYTKPECGDFFHRIWFGNYVPEICGVGDANKAEMCMKENRTEYNNQLFSFINANEIATIVCFSKATYWKLPSSDSSDTHVDIEIPSTDGKRNVIHRYQYAPGIVRDGCEVTLEKPLLVYGVRHPSARSGYNARDVYDVFAKEPALSYVCKSNVV